MNDEGFTNSLAGVCVKGMFQVWVGGVRCV